MAAEDDEDCKIYGLDDDDDEDDDSVEDEAEKNKG